MKDGRLAIINQSLRARSAVLGAFLLFLVISPAAAAEVPSLLWQVPEDQVSGEDSGRLGGPEAVAVNQETGHVYVAERTNARVSEFDPWGQFVRAWGWGVDDGASEFQICEADCQGGVKGPGPGQFQRQIGIAVGPDGSVYAGDPDNFRIEKFDSEGHFLLEWGEEGTGPGQFHQIQFGQYLAAGPDGTIYVAEEGRVQAFESDGTFKEEIPFEGDLAPLAGKRVSDLAVDADGNLYITAYLGGKSVEEIIKFNTAGELVAPGSFPLAEPFDLALDSAGNLYTTEVFREIVEFDKDANLLIAPGSGFGSVAPPITGLASSSACGIEGSDLFASANNGTTEAFITAYGPPPDPDICPPPVTPPTITRQFASSVSSGSAAVNADINPHFWPDTTFYVEYGPGKCSEGGCTSRQPAGDQLLTEEVVDRSIAAEVNLDGLESGTEYHYRFVAESGGGGPTVGGEKTFKTFGPSEQLTCPNDGFRTGAAAFLSDCRAYEMVSPVDKGGGEIFTLLNSLNEPASLNQSSLSGDRITYSSYRSFANPKSAPVTAQYLASRGGSGWSTQPISPPRGTPHSGLGPTVETQFRAFSSDLCEAWLVHDTDPPLAPDAPENFPNLYKTNLCDGEDSYETMTTSPPEGQIPDAYRVTVQGFSVDGTHTVFRARGKLTENAAINTNYQCYEHFEGKLRLVSLLPSGQPNPSNCSVGMAYGAERPAPAQLHNAVSQDGSRIYWTAGSLPAVEKGRIYLRVNGKNPTLAVSQAGESLSETPAESNYWTASPDGSKAIYSTGSLSSGKADAYEYRIADKSTHLIAHKVAGYLGSSGDASIIYLASKEVLSGTNGEGKSPVAGEPNLYRYEAGDGSFHFVAVLSALDADSDGWSPLSNRTSFHTARVSEDGRIAAFMSTASLTGFDNVDVNSGEADAEVFRYDAQAGGGEGGLTCVSCNPTGIAPTGRELTLVADGAASLGIWAAAQLVPSEAPLGARRSLPEGGNRVLFESFEPLVGRDTNEKQDVYQWSAVGAGRCTEASGDYSPTNSGCLALISSGQSTRDAKFVDASADGRDVFFTTASSLVAQDPGLIDLYDAREGGGFPPPPPPLEPCHDEGCQNSPPAPAALNPPTQGQSEGNVVPKSHKCHKGKTYSKKKKHCVKKQAKKHKKANKSGRAGR